MIGSLNPNQRKVTVVGGGVAGLLAAYRLDQLGYEVSLYEASARLGGMITTEMVSLGMVESAAHSLLATPAVVKLFDELKVELLPVRKKSRARYIVRNGKLRRFPLSPAETLSTAYRLLTRKSKGHTDSLSEWARYFLGEAAHDFILSPFLLGIYGSSPDEISVDAAFPRLAVPEGKTFFSHLLQSRERHAQRFMAAPANGMGAFVNALASHVKARLGSRLHLNEHLSDLSEDENIVLCVPAHDAGHLIKKIDPQSHIALSKTRYAPLVTCTVFIRKSAHRAPKGVGFLVPPKEGRSILGVLFNSSSFLGRVLDEEQFSSYTVMLGGSLSPHWIQASDKQISEAVTSEFKYFFSLKGELEEIRIRRWQQAIPVYGSELVATWRRLETGWCNQHGHIIFGNYAGQVSLRGMIEDVLSWNQRASE